MQYRRSNCRGMSLLEIMAVVTLMGIFAAVAIARLGPTIFGDIGSQTDARRVGLALLQAKRRAISTGNNHAVVFQNDASGKLAYTVVSIDSSGGTSLVDGPYSFSQNVTPSVSSGSMTFTFEGQALG